MLQPKVVIKFSLIATAVYAVLSWTWPMFAPAYARYFQGFGNVAFSQFWFWPQGEVDFLDLKLEPDALRRKVNVKLPAPLPDAFKLPKAAGVVDTLMILKNRDVPAVPGFVRTSSRLIGYTPTAVLLSLVLATPIAWKRRWWLLFWSMLLVHVVVAIRLTALLLRAGFADPQKQYALFHPGALMQDLIHRGGVILADNPTFAYIVAVFVWIAAFFLVQLWYEWVDKRRDAKNRGER